MTTVTPAVETGTSPSFSSEEAWRLLDLVDTSFRAHDLEDLANGMLPAIARLMQSPSAILYVTDPRLTAPYLLPYGAPPLLVPELEHLCTEQFEQVSRRSDLRPVTVSTSLGPGISADLVLSPLQTARGCCGLLGLPVIQGADSVSSETKDRLLHLLANTVDRLVERAESDRQLTHLNTYLTVSSLLVQSFNLHELLEGVLYCCMDVVSAEAASVLLLDDDMSSLRFYHVEGLAKPGLKDATLPLDEGIAGHVLRTREPLIIRDAQSDARFCDRFDSESGFHTRNMIAIPLIIDQQPIGVLEVLNKVDADSFTEDEQMLLATVAEEIALAIRNAKVFEYVANSYCKQRQGETSCRGCTRPLGAWTPCVQYRKTTVSGLWRISDIMDYEPSG